MSHRIYPASWAPIPDTPYTNVFSCTFPPLAEDKFAPGTPAFIDYRTGTTILRGDVRRLVLELAYGLTQLLPRIVKSGWNGQLNKGDTVLLLSPNTIAFPIALYSIIAAGMTVSPANSAYTPTELLHQLRDSRSKAIIVHPVLVPVAVKALVLAGFSEKEARARVIVCDLLKSAGPLPEGVKNEFVWMEELLGKGSLSEEVRFDGPDASTTAFLCYSSGTTSKPKGVMTSHKNVVSCLRMLDAMGDELVAPNEVAMGIVPFFHILGLTGVVFQTAAAGGTIITMDRFDPVAFVQSIEKYKVTASVVVPPILLALTRHPVVDKHDVSSLKMVLSAAAPLGEPLARQFHERMLKRGANVTVLQGYGLTETSPSVLMVPRSKAHLKYGSAGALMSSIELRLVADDGSDAPHNGPGEIWVRGPNVMNGYLNNEAATRDSITEDGWFKTGDIATRDDDGFYSIVDRKKELIKYKGFQVPPAELESVLLQHPDVADAAVIGIEDQAEATELPRAYIVAANPAVLKDDKARKAFAKSVQTWIRTRVAKHKYLRGGCIVIDAIPKSAAGKILRKDLRIIAAEELKNEKPARAKL